MPIGEFGTSGVQITDQERNYHNRAATQQKYSPTSSFQGTTRNKNEIPYSANVPSQN
jgi:hypothetical protein